MTSLTKTTGVNEMSKLTIMIDHIKAREESIGRKLSVWSKVKGLVIMGLTVDTKSIESATKNIKAGLVTFK